MAHGPLLDVLRSVTAIYTRTAITWSNCKIMFSQTFPRPFFSNVVSIVQTPRAYKYCKHGSRKKRWRQTMLTLSELGLNERWKDYAHFVRVGGSMNGGQTMLTLSELGVRQR